MQNSFRAIHENANVNSKTKSLTQSCEWKCIFFGKKKQCWSTVKVKVNTMQPSYFIPIKHFSSIDLVYEWKPSRNKFLDHDEILNQEISKKCKWVRELPKYKWQRSSKKASGVRKGTFKYWRFAGKTFYFYFFSFGLSNCIVEGLYYSVFLLLVELDEWLASKVDWGFILWEALFKQCNGTPIVSLGYFSYWFQQKLQLYILSFFAIGWVSPMDWRFCLVDWQSTVSNLLFLLLVM